ncbi:Chymotrypsin-like elastase family member 2A [Smittium culicis]|uniref:Chymotrypsin-like elastase family member 2A n=1 Tax=Smittium culicis TaxID=133412 RepID=A0A1R1YF92_9FUNG|nr:Chymotrypsin-like elastase family member 2A [Smittium culicis]
MYFIAKKFYIFFGIIEAVLSFKFGLNKSLLSRTNSANSISSGSNLVDNNDFNFAASLLILDGDTFKTCAAAILTKSWLITSADCVVLNAFTDFKNFRVGTGSFNRANQKYYSVQRIIVHPDYNTQSNSPDNNIALIKLDTEINLNNETGVIKIHNNDSIENSSDRIILGWENVGQVMNEEASLNLSYLTSGIKSEDFCGSFDANFSNNSKKLLCIGFTDGSSTLCNEDAGSLLLKKSPDGNSYSLDGIISYGKNTDGSDSPDCKPGNGVAYFLRVKEYMSFINYNIGNDGSDIVEIADGKRKVEDNKDENDDFGGFKQASVKASIASSTSILSKSSNIVYFTVTTDTTITTSVTNRITSTVNSCSPTLIKVTTSTRKVSVFTTSTNTRTATVGGSTITSSVPLTPPNSSSITPTTSTTSSAVSSSTTTPNATSPSTTTPNTTSPSTTTSSTTSDTSSTTSSSLSSTVNSPSQLSRNLSLNSAITSVLNISSILTKNSSVTKINVVTITRSEKSIQNSKNSQLTTFTKTVNGSKNDLNSIRDEFDSIKKSVESAIKGFQATKTQDSNNIFDII